MTSSNFAVVALRAMDLDVRVDSVLMPSDQNAATAEMLQFRGLVNPEIRVIKIEVEPEDTSDTVTERLNDMTQADLAELFRESSRFLPAARDRAR